MRGGRSPLPPGIIDLSSRFHGAHGFIPFRSLPVRGFENPRLTFCCLVFPDGALLQMALLPKTWLRINICKVGKRCTGGAVLAQEKCCALLFFLPFTLDAGLSS